MSQKHHHIAFLCGYFKRTREVKSPSLQELGWTPVSYSDKERREDKRFYYPDFVDFCHGQSMDEGCVRFSRQIDKGATMMVGKEGERHQLSFTVKELTLYFLPQCMVLYSIHLELDASSLDDCSALMFRLRYIDGYGDEDYAAFNHVAVQPIVEVYNILKDNCLQDYTQLVENGNKLRLFQIVHAAQGSLSDAQHWKRQLYQLATFMPVAVDYQPGDDEMFAEHQRQVLSKDGLTAFPGWTALALLDSFTILAVNNECQTVNWVERYFDGIYIHALFQKICLFDFNNRFKQALNNRSRKRAERDMEQLMAEYDAFERNCCFNKISYNFLPLLVADYINRSLEINDEMHQLFRIMARERSRSEERSRKRMNSLLLCISFLTVFSAIWDASSMLSSMFSFESRLGGLYQGFRITGMVMLVLVLCVLVYLYRKRKY